MKGVILNNGEKFYTDLKNVFKAINNLQLNYNWLLTNCECYPQNKKYAEILSKKFCWLSGEELTEMVNNENFQWIWVVLSGFTKDIIFDDVDKHKLPVADGNERFWQNPVIIQHPLASVEIVSWDGCLTLLISNEAKIVDLFRSNFKLSKDLEIYNDEL